MPETSALTRLLRFCLEQKLIVVLLVLLIAGWGIAVAPFDWETGWLPRHPVAVDAIPNLGENQQIVFTEWPGRSPQDVEDQLTYPLTVALLGVPGVREVRSLSMFGFSSIFVVLDEGVEFYWSRSRILERLSSLPAGTLPPGVQPTLGPDATALGQIFWYTIEGRDPDGNPLGGWDLHELRTVQDWYVRYGLLAAGGISEVASIGGFVKEYQVDVNPDAMRTYGVTLNDVHEAVRMSNLDVGARTTEINSVEYILRGVGFIQELKHLEQAVVRQLENNIPVRVKDVATVAFGPAERRGALTVSGAEAVGGVVVVREGFNPLLAINNVKDRIREVSPGLPARAHVDWSRTSLSDLHEFGREQGIEVLNGPSLNHENLLTWLRTHPRERWPEWLTINRLEIVPFYDRTDLIHETLATLNDALIQQILVTVLVVIVMLLHLRTALVISSMLPMAILMCFIAMKLAGVEANIVALAGIAIAIGTIVDMGLIVSENVVKHLSEASPEESRLEVVYRGASEVSSAVLTAILTTIVSFLPVFTMTGAEGKMFAPLAYTKTFVLFASVVLAIAVIPAFAHMVIARRLKIENFSTSVLRGLLALGSVLFLAGIALGWNLLWPAALLLIAYALYRLFGEELPPIYKNHGGLILNVSAVLVVTVALTLIWEPLGAQVNAVLNFLFIVLLFATLLGGFLLFLKLYPWILSNCLENKGIFLSIPATMIFLGLLSWLGFNAVFSFVPGERFKESRPWTFFADVFPGLGREFMPPLDEGSFLWMPTTMPHASIGEVLEVLKYQDTAIAAIPEVESVTGKLGRAESPLDPAPISMIETVIHYKPEFKTDASGRRLTFKIDRRRNEFARDADGELIPHRWGRPFRQWRDHIRSPDDIWSEIASAAHIPGTTSAPKLQPIETRLVMLQTGMRAPMGIKLRAADLNALDRMAVDFEAALRHVPSVRQETVNAERIVGKPYLEIHIDREAISRYGLNIMDVQETIATAIGGETITTTVEGRERYPVRVRYPRELRHNIEALASILVAGMDGQQVPLGELTDIRYVRGPQMIRSEDTFLTAYITFGGRAGLAEVDVVEEASRFLEGMIADGHLLVPEGASYRFAGTYEHQLRAAATLRVVLPLSLVIIFLILYFQFRKVSTTLIVFSGIAVAWAGGFIMIWFYAQPWFADFYVFGVNMRDTFQLHAINLSVAVWVGFLALFGIAVDDGVVMATYLRQSFDRLSPKTIKEIREAALAAGMRRVRPCLMTSATTILALLPVLTSTGRGADIMIPMAIPVVGGMSFVLISMFTVPVLYSLLEEIKLKNNETGRIL